MASEDIGIEVARACETALESVTESAIDLGSSLLEGVNIDVSEIETRLSYADIPRYSIWPY